MPRRGVDRKLGYDLVQLNGRATGRAGRSEAQ